MAIRRALTGALLVLWPVTGSLLAQGVRATVHGGVYLRQQVVSVPVIEGELGDVAFDPSDGNRLYILVDDEILLGGGVYRLDEIDGMLVRGELLASEANPSGIAFTPEGDLWLVRDLSAGSGYLFRIPSPRSGPPYTLETVLTGFLGPADDDPKVLAVAPPGFASDLVQPGDIIIGEAGADADPFNALYVYSPANPPAAPEAHDEFLVPPQSLALYDDINLIDLDFAMTGDVLFALFASGAIVRVHADGSVERPLAVPGLNTATAAALAVSPLDGRVWVGIGSRHEIWSIDPGTGEARLEISFASTSPSWPLEAIRFHSPSLRFSPDGRRLAVTDTQSQLWVFDAVDAPGNRPPVAHIANDHPGQVIAMLGGFGEVELDGAGSSDGDGDTQTLTYFWSRVSGPADAEIEDVSGARTMVTFTTPGIYIFALRVDDGQAAHNVATAQLGLGVLALEATHEGTFESYQALPMGGVAGDVAFSPGPEAALLALVDDLPAQGGGVYEILAEGAAYRRGRRLAALDRPSSLAFTADGDLWIVRDFVSSAAAGPYLGVMRRPLEEPLATLEPAITQFAGAADDDPFVVVVVPPGFESDQVAAGDLLILDHGADGNDSNVIYRYSPAAPAGDPAAYAELFATAEQLAAFFATDLNDLAFSRDGSRLFVASEGLGIAEIDGDGNVAGTLETGGAPINNVAGLAVDPETGRLWVADAGLRQVWSIDLEAPSAQLEISFAIGIAEFGVLPIDLHAPSLSFSPDGQRLVVSDAGNKGWLWIFEKPVPPPPVARFRRGDANGSTALDISDPILVLGYLFLGSKPPACLDAADGDDNGAIDISDAVYVLGYLFGGSRAPPLPGPLECGEDPSGDALGSCGVEAGC